MNETKTKLLIMPESVKPFMDEQFELLIKKKEFKFNIFGYTIDDLDEVVLVDETLYVLGFIDNTVQFEGDVLITLKNELQYVAPIKGMIFYDVEEVGKSTKSYKFIIPWENVEPVDD